MGAICRLGNRRYSRFGNLRYGGGALRRPRHRAQRQATEPKSSEPPQSSYARESADDFPSPEGEGRDEGGHGLFPQGLESTAPGSEVQ